VPVSSGFQPFVGAIAQGPNVPIRTLRGHVLANVSQIQGESLLVSTVVLCRQLVVRGMDTGFGYVQYTLNVLS